MGEEKNIMLSRGVDRERRAAEESIQKA